MRLWLHVSATAAAATGDGVLLPRGFALTRTSTLERRREGLLHGRRLDTYSTGSYRSLCATLVTDWDQYPSGDFEPEGCDTGGWAICKTTCGGSCNYWTPILYAPDFPYAYCCRRAFTSVNYYYTVAQKSVCPCPAGQFSLGGWDAIGTCDLCPAGQYSLEGGDCQDCEAGKFAASSGTGTCAECASGQYVSSKTDKTDASQASSSWSSNEPTKPTEPTD